MHPRTDRRSTVPQRIAIAFRRTLLVATSIVVLGVVGRVPRAFAAAGDLDAGFGTGGKVTTDFGFGGNDTGFAVVVQPDGKIVTAGQCLGSFCLVRHNADGSLDDGGPDDSTPGDAFGVGGSVVTGFGTDTAEPTSMVRQPDGKLVVLGSCGAVTTNVCIIRYNVDGSLDDGGPNDSTPGDAFGTGGIVANTAGPAVGYAVALQTDGKIVVAGGCVGPDACVLRFNADGSFDDGGPDDSTPGDAFGTAGIAKADFGTVIDQFNAVTIDQTSDKIVAAGGCFLSGSLNFCIARFNPDGTLDSNSDADPTTHLGTTGAVTLDFGGADMAKAVAIQPADGKIVVAGRCAFNFLGTFCVGRLNTNGTIDTSFNSTGAVPGIVITTFSPNDDDTLNALVIQPNGKLVVAGICSSGACLVRYNADGSLDTDSDADPSIHFNHTGKVTSATLVLAFALARQPTDGKLVAAGVCGSPDHFDFCIARYDTQGAVDLTLAGTGFVTKDFGGGNETGEAIVRGPNDKVVVAGQCNGKFCAARYDLNGDLDGTFGNGGLVTTDVPGGGVAHGLVRQTDGKRVNPVLS